MPEIRPPGPDEPSGDVSGLRVSMIGSLPPVKGVSAYTAHLVQALSSDGHIKLDFFGFRSIYPRGVYPGGAPDEAGLAAPGLPRVKLHNTLTWYNPLSWLHAGLTLRGDVVHAQWWSYALAPVYATVLGLARLRGKRVVMTVHNVAPHEDSRWKRLLNRRMFGFADMYIVHSEQNKETLQAALGCAAERIEVLPHGVLETPRTGMSRSRARLRLGIAGEGRVLLCFGNIRPYKGVDVLLRAFARVLRDEPDTVLVIAGKPWTGWAPYDALIDELGVRDSLRLFLDYVATSEVEAFFVAADAVVLPYTHFDAQTGVGTRALPFGRPLIVSAVGGLPELVLNRDAVVPPGDDAALATALVRVLRDGKLRDRMSVDSLALAATLGWESIARRTAAIYARLAGVPETGVDSGEGMLGQVAGARRT